MKRRFFMSLLTAVVVTSAGICLPPNPDFSGTWKQSNDRCVPKRKGEVIRRIEQSGGNLVVETNIVRTSGPPRHAVQRYNMDGSTSVSTGADGDEFHTSVAWKGPSLVFRVEEHEDGRIINSTETWTLTEDGSTLEVDRESLGTSADPAKKQTIIYSRQTRVSEDR